MNDTLLDRLRAAQGREAKPPPAIQLEAADEIEARTPANTIHSTSGLYTLDGHGLVPAEDLLSWARWIEDADIKVGDTKIGKVRVSTVFLGIDQRSSGEGPPILFETLLSIDEISDSGLPPGDPASRLFDGDGDRYCTFQEAENGHSDWCEKVRADIADKGR